VAGRFLIPQPSHDKPGATPLAPISHRPFLLAFGATLLDSLYNLRTERYVSNVREGSSLAQHGPAIFDFGFGNDWLVLRQSEDRGLGGAENAAAYPVLGSANPQN
jgi:hypothetical protein